MSLYLKNFCVWGSRSHSLISEPSLCSLFQPVAAQFTQLHKLWFREVSVSFLSLRCPCVHRVSEFCCCCPLAVAPAHRSFSAATVQIRARCCSQLFPDWSPCFPRCFSSQLVVYLKWNLTVFLSLKPLRTPVRSKSKVLNIVVITNLYSSCKTKTESPLGVPDYPTTGDCLLFCTVNTLVPGFYLLRKQWRKPASSCMKFPPTQEECGGKWSLSMVTDLKLHCGKAY